MPKREFSIFQFQVNFPPVGLEWMGLDDGTTMAEAGASLPPTSVASGMCPGHVCCLPAGTGPAGAAGSSSCRRDQLRPKAQDPSLPSPFARLRLDRLRVSRLGLGLGKQRRQWVTHKFIDYTTNARTKRYAYDCQEQEPNRQYVKDQRTSICQMSATTIKYVASVNQRQLASHQPSTTATRLSSGSAKT